MIPSINIGPLAIPTAGLLYIFGAYICLEIIEKTAVRLKQNATDIYTLGVLTLAAGIVGARLVFVTEYWAAFRQSLLSIIWPLNTGYNVWAGVFIGAAAGFFYARAKRLPPAATADALLPGLLVGFLVISLADFLAGPGYGTISRLPWAISQFGIKRHPVQIYEILLAVLALLVWWRVTGKPYRAGVPFLMATAVYAAGRLFTDAYRANTLLLPNGLHLWQIVAFGVLVTVVFLLRFTLPPAEAVES